MTENVQANYSRGGLQQAVLDALVADGFDPDDLDPDALTPAEEFHTFGRVATIALAEAAAITATDRVIDVGSGLGGPARHLARAHGCHVLGVDLTQELCDVATDLTRRVGLSDQVEIRQGDALALPVPDASFDVVWTQHVSMNIADKARLFQEMRRVVRPGGRLAFFDLLSGPNQPIHFPVPWAEDPSASALATADETRDLVTGAGFEIRLWEDLTAEAVGFYASLAAGPSPDRHLGLHLLITDMPTKGANLKRNVEEDRLALVRCVAVAI
ncbi:class I SAM-dependent methyltransferase [Actinospongicola halichondriae]|uniref:class I SAM-dependent methyltransferase n=1 Tax=Actinospongicola halichondriae TaxID=3236844 RepID=UPI003D4F71CD